MQSNSCPFCDQCDLVAVTDTLDSDGYATSTETKTSVWCSIIDGVSRKEFYEAEKAGHRLTTTIEVWSDDYTGQKLVDVNSKRYSVVRAYPSGHGPVELYCEEEVR